MKSLAPIAAALLLLLQAVCSGGQPYEVGWRGALAEWAVSLSPSARGVYGPYLDEIMWRAELAGTFNVSHLARAVLDYYRLAVEELRVNELEASAKHLGTALGFLTNLIKFPEGELASEAPALSAGLSAGDLKAYPSVEEALKEASLAKPRSVEDYLRVYGSVALTMLDEMPLSGFERMVYTPFLREAYLAGVIATALLFSLLLRRRARYELEEVKYEGRP